MRETFFVKVFGVLLFLASELSTAATAACVAPPLSNEVVLQFKSNPSPYFAPTTDIRTIESFVRDLAGTEPALSADILRQADGATLRVRTAIAAGLAQAAVACSNIDQHAALLIQQAVAQFQDVEFQNAFAAVAGDLSTAATAAATNSAAVSAGSVVIVNPIRSAGLARHPGGGGSIAPLQIAAGGIAGANTDSPTLGANSTSSATAANPVSATR